MTTRPAAPPPPAPQQTGKSPRSTIPSIVPLTLTSGPDSTPDKIVIYGTGGIGKSTLAAYLPAPAFLDVERSTKKLNVSKDLVSDWPMLRGKLASIAQSPPKGIRTIVIDTGTKAEELAKDFVIETRKTEKDKVVSSIEGFGWGKGWQFVYDEFQALLADLDRINDKGLYVVIIAHSVATPVPNPDGEDYLQWQPLLYAGDKKGRGSVRDAIKNWTDQLLFLDYDVMVEKDSNKGVGSGTRSIHTFETPTHVAKSRTKAITIPYDLSDPTRVWRELGIV